MRRYRNELKGAGKKVIYYKLESRPQFFKKLSSTIKRLKTKQIQVFEIEDSFFEKQFKNFCKKEGVELEVIQSPMFMVSRHEFGHYLKRVRRPFMKTFYEEQRREKGILMNKDGTPKGGKFSYDTENRKKIPKKEEVIPLELPQRSNEVVEEVKKLVEKEFKSHPGSVDKFWLATTRREALAWLDKFIKTRLDKFGDYEDALDDRDPFLYHSVISPYINIGFLTPEEVVKKVAQADAGINSKEGFIRQVMGWREFMRGIYHNFESEMNSTNFFGHKSKLTNDWYDATTGIPPVDDAIKKAKEFGWCHHIERLMVLSNIMLLCEIDPQEVYKWFMEMFVDSADWVMAPNIFGMGQFSDGGIFATKPYICGSNYIKKMGHYHDGPWRDIWDGLYWRFIDKKKDIIAKNPRMTMMVKLLDKIDSQKKKKIFNDAQVFINSKTKG